MNSIPLLLIGIPAAAVRFAQWKLERRSVEAEPEVERADAWSGFEAARLNNPPLSEMETR